MSGLDRRAREMLNALRVESTPSADRVDAELARIESRIAAFAVRDVDDELDPPEHAPPAVAPVSASFVAKCVAISVGIAAIVLLALGFVAIGVQALVQAPDRRLEGAVDVPVPTAPDRALVRAPTNTATVPLVATTPLPEKAADPRVGSVEAARPTRGTTAVRTSSDLAAEVALLRAAAAEIDATAALAMLEEHTRTFPDSARARHRDVLRAERLCALGRTDEARRAIDRFLADHRDDPLAQRMSRACVTGEGRK